MLSIPGPIDSRATHLTTFTVKAGGAPLPPEFGIVAIDIRREINRIPRATLTLSDGDPAAQTFALSEQAQLIPGAEVEILGGYSSEETSLFKGVVTRHRVEVHRRGGSNLVVEMRDPVFRMAIGRRSRNFSEVSDGDVIEQLIGFHAGLSADVAATAVTHPQIVQHQASDWDFMVMRAEMAGLAVVCVDGKVVVAAPTVAGAAAAAAVFGQGLFAAELELDAENQLASVETGAWDPAGQALATAQADDAPTAAPGDIKGSDLAGTATAGTAPRESGLRDAAELDAWAAAAMGRARRAAVRGRIRVQGTEALVPNSLIELGGFGSRFNGLALVSGVRHRLGRGDWTTEAIVGTDPRPHHERFQVAAPGAAGLLPPVRGLQVGIVSALEADPAGEERIEIRLPTISETDGLVWARLALLDAGSSRGTVIRPDVGDEVVVGFLDDDPRDPIVLGALHSSAKASPIPGADANQEKAVVTRSGMRIHWDDEKIVTTIETPAGNSIVLSEQDSGITITDQNGNSLKMSAEGIALESVKDVTIKAAVDLKGEGGANAELKAGASLKAEGSASAEISSSGATTVKGSIVNIN
jgi:Rhs element Vgr protein